MGRKTIKKEIREKLLGEYNHKCAICGADKPQIHHIDEDSSNNEILNLLPLCPNCHLTDQHNPNRKVDVLKLKLFRNHKSLLILEPQFHPIYIRQLFLEEIEINEDNVKHLWEQSKELVEFLAEFEMGTYYSQRVNKLVNNNGMTIVIGGLNGDHSYENARRQKMKNLDYRQKLVDNKDKVQSLIVELLAYQKW